ncbi:MAG: ArsR/SmtB family transcription factor [Sphingobacteriales bacterium]
MTETEIPKPDVYKAIADPTRRQIMDLLLTDHPLTIQAITNKFDASRQATSKHIYVLEQAGLIRIEDKGRERYCFPHFIPLKEVTHWLAFYKTYWEDRISDLENYLDSQ